MIDPTDALCDDQTCSPIDKGGKPLYKDGGHIRASFSKNNITYVDQILN